MANWGYHIKRLREARHITQEELAKATGLERSHLSQMELGKYETFKLETIRGLARAFGLPVSELLLDIAETKEGRRVENPEQILERLRLSQPIAIPVFDEFPVHAGEGVEPMDYVYISRNTPAPKNLEAYRVSGSCLAPAIENGDTIVINREGAVNTGDLAAGLVRGELHLGRVRQIAEDTYLENNAHRFNIKECVIIAPIIQVVRRLK